MGILNIGHDGLPSVLIVLYKMLLTNGGVSRETLINLCVPPNIDDPLMARLTLNRWIELGLFDESENGVAITKELRQEGRCVDGDMERLPRTLRQIVLNPDNCEQFWNTEATRSADFARAISWVLAQDVYRFAPRGFSDVEQLNKKQVQDEVSPFQIDRNWVAFKIWAPYLGFAWNARHPVIDALVVDPTPAIREELKTIFAIETVLDIAAFLARIVEVIPVLDGGRYRKKLEEKMDPHYWNHPSINELSTSLSRALIRIHTSGIISLENRSDAPERRLLIGREGKILREVTHVRWKGGVS